MKAAVLPDYHQSLEIRDVPVPEIGPTEVLIKVHACGICGSDVHLVNEKFKGMSTVPVIPGHEVAGVVEKVGEQVNYLKCGDAFGAAKRRTRWYSLDSAHLRSLPLLRAR